MAGRTPLASLDHLPIQFRRVRDGVYVSRESKGTESDMFRVERSVHAGRRRTSVRWHATHVGTGQAIGQYGAKYWLSRDDAIRGVNAYIGRGLQRGFAVLAHMSADAQRVIRVAAATREARAKLEADVTALWRDGGLDDPPTLLVARVVDLIERHLSSNPNTTVPQRTHEPTTDTVQKTAETPTHDLR